MASLCAVDGMFQEVQRILSYALPNDRVRSLKLLEGGATNRNVLVRLEGCDQLFVLRQHLRGAEVCRKEVHLLQVLQNLIPVPELVRSDVTGDEAGFPYLLYRFLPGQTFRQIRANGSPRDMANAAHAIGRCLGALQRCDVSFFGSSGLDRRYKFNERNLDCPVLRERIGAEDLSLLQRTYVKWSQALHELANAESLVHGDFNHRNIVLNQEGWPMGSGRHSDWELASIGSSLWDAARFMCYEKPDSLHWESHFLLGFRATSTGIPDAWEELARVMNTLSAAGSLANESVQERFIPELKRLVHCGLRGKRIT
jgi:aminoglycoside phosphotransferase (APT) family kinase protein